MEVIQTFVLFDLETSGLPRGALNPCKITEMSLVAASRQHILDKHSGAYKENTEAKNNYLPRVLNKLTCLVYPCKMIHPMASEVSGLTNEDLEHQRPFDEKLFEVMNNFLERLEKPICLVAHNGNKFDFPLLQSELLKINKALPEHVFCSDSLLGFREVLADEDTERNNGLPGITPLNKKCSGNPSETLPKCEWSNEDYDAELIQAVDLADKLTFGQHVFNANELEAKINIEMERIRKSNERTPVRRTRHPIKGHSYGKVSDMSDISNRIKENSVRRKLVTDSPQPKRKYNLGALYESLTGKEFVNAHQAEADSLALLECITAVGKPMIEWLDRNRVPFRSIKKMW